jgi:superfamily II DNA or RNA helicase
MSTVVEPDAGPAFPVGSLVSARGREWVVLPESDLELLVLRPLGATDEEIAGILPALETVTSATFEPPSPDQVGDHRSAQLLRDALRLGFRSSAGPFRSFGRIAVEPRPYQLVPLLLALKQDPVRLLIADDVGVGKTIEAGLIARELLDQGTVRRISILCPPHLAEQWQSELREKFQLDAELVLSSTAARLERGLPLGASLFDHYPITIVSTDYIKAERRRDEFVRAAPELLIIDEAHTFAPAGDKGRQLRFELAKKLAAAPTREGDAQRHIVLVTATPHSGNVSSFRDLLSLLDPTFADLPDELGGAKNQELRNRMARHIVQRRRDDIKRYLDQETPFPTRVVEEHTYKLTPDYRSLLDRAIAYAKESYIEAEGDQRQQRIRWWSALALLRAIGSSPAAAASTLRNRAQVAEAVDADAADELGQRTVMDQAGDTSEVESVDVAPGVRGDDLRRDDWFTTMARAAEALEGKGDPKLQAFIPLIKKMVKRGQAPIVFCRFIPTAEYVAEHLRLALGKSVEVGAVTGTLPASERERRVTELGQQPKRVLVCTDCLSEGINLQDDFDAVLHYDLSWNPTRHEQREGRVDRFGQQSETVTIASYYGEDSPIDGIVLDVLIRKHERIRKALGVSVPVPQDGGAVINAILEGLIARGQDSTASVEQLALFNTDDVQGTPEVEAARQRSKDLNGSWDTAFEREKRNRTIFAQDAVDTAEVARELGAARDAIGSGTDAGRFLRNAVLAYGGRVREDRRTMTLDISGSSRKVALQDALGLRGERTEAVLPFGPAGRVQRTDALVQALASFTMDEALDARRTDAVAARSAVIRTEAVEVETFLLLLRLRFRLRQGRGQAVREQIAEDTHLLAFTGAPSAPTWLSDEAATALLDAVPGANVLDVTRRKRVEWLVAGLPQLEPALRDVGERFAAQLEETHRRVRDATRARGAGGTATGGITAEAQLPDVLGAYIYRPIEDS